MCCIQTCYIIKFPEVHFNVIPLHDHAAVGVGCSHRHVDVLFKGEDIRRHGLNGNGLMTHEVCEAQERKKNSNWSFANKKELTLRGLNHIL